MILLLTGAKAEALHKKTAMSKAMIIIFEY
jgi:hypothetical protein